MRRSVAIFVGIALCFVVGITASYFQKDSLMNWYPLLNKPAVMPPNVVFPIAWSIIYVCIGISGGLVASTRHERRFGMLLLFGLQLLFNFAWSLLFFYSRNPLWGLIDIVLLDVVAISYMLHGWKMNKAAACLFIPYVLWLLFATYLNGYVFFYN